MRIRHRFLEVLALVSAITLGELIGSYTTNRSSDAKAENVVRCSCSQLENKTKSAQITQLAQSQSSQASKPITTQPAKTTKIQPQLLLVRDVYTDKSTTGRLYRYRYKNKDGKSSKYELIGYALEPPWRNNQAKISSITTGIFSLKPRTSSKHGEHLILENTQYGDLKGRDFVLIHPGNFPKDTEGCILPGKTRGKDYVGQSKIAEREILEIQKQEGDLYLQIVDEKDANYAAVRAELCKEK